MTTAKVKLSKLARELRSYYGRKIIVAGGRDYSNYIFLAYVLENLAPIRVVTGGARGADSLALFWAKTNKIIHQAYHPDWGRDGAFAGHLRNQEMLDKEPECTAVILFKGGRGTSDMRMRTLRKPQIKLFDLQDWN